jgi:hypothetical protein
LSDQSPDDFPWGERLGADWETPDDDALPDKGGVLSYLDDVERVLIDWIKDADLLVTDDLHPWTGRYKVGRALYVLRHTQHHTAEILADILRRGYDVEPGWR